MREANSARGTGTTFGDLVGKGVGETKPVEEKSYLLAHVSYYVGPPSNFSCRPIGADHLECFMPRNRSKAALTGGVGLSLSLVGAACESSSARASLAPESGQTRPAELLAEEELFDVSLASFYVVDKENPRVSPYQRVAAYPGWWWGCRGCRGCGCRSANSKSSRKGRSCH
jgi:hypothetical protein